MSATIRRTRRTAALLLGATLVTLTATACDSTGGPSVSTEAKQTPAATAPAAGAATSAAAKPADSKPAESKPAEAAKAPAKVGDTIALKGTLEKGNTADVTALKVVDPAQSSNEYLHAEDGKHYVAVQFQIKPTGAKAYSEAPWSAAKVVDDQGQAYGPTLAETKAGPSFQTPTNIASGETGKGFVVFEVPNGTKLDKVQFSLDNGFADQVGQWKLG
ncbi:DUF4352 domain-containing protein [Kitasatospora purpeofusca]|uniref:DUF4352 domain-containing protein n=1 Tax=Kitasatospora purpeofusca TaxID=67352 RepID=UPI002256611C|nr:DUF4352 domain-containing protein [Kitasatospora purpeofusca]MCX4754585.1 DUF4352 domain-containing protein [Kitasatospora purpeofusca]WSR33996.1 DUF4352 domain-containing protein [Kitasatospora purpeofusca]